MCCTQQSARPGSLSGPLSAREKFVTARSGAIAKMRLERDGHLSNVPTTPYSASKTQCRTPLPPRLPVRRRGDMLAGRVRFTAVREVSGTSPGQAAERKLQPAGTTGNCHKSDHARAARDSSSITASPATDFPCIRGARSRAHRRCAGEAVRGCFRACIRRIPIPPKSPGQ